jgi:ubiquinone/menaquinone biosynthesis C-methylase UbiE
MKGTGHSGSDVKEEVVSGTPTNAAQDESHYRHLAPWLRLVTTLRMLGPRKNGETMVLDVGCGDGTLMSHLGGKCVGVDVSTSALESARAKTGAEVVMASASTLPFRDESFDLVICTEVLEHLDEMEAAIGQLASVAKRDGTVHFTVPVASWYRLVLFRLLGARPYYLSEAEHKREFSVIPVERFSPISTLVSTIRHYGLEIEDVKGSCFFPDKIEGPLDAIADASSRMRGLVQRIDATINRLPSMKFLGRYLAMSCRRTHRPRTSSP